MKVSEKQAYEWVKIGHWSLAEFSAWVAEKLTEKYSEAFDDGYQEGSSDSILKERG